MTMSFVAFAITSILATAVLAAKWVLGTNLKRAPLPPGPRGLPIIGNAFDMPTEQPWKVFARWGKIYGPITHLRVLQQHLIILNSPLSAASLLASANRAANYSDRPSFIVGAELTGWKHMLPLTPYGPVFREHRRLLHRAVGTRVSARRFEGVQEAGARRMVRAMVESPGEFEDHIRMGVGDNILTISHGYSTRDDVLGFVKTADRMAEQFLEFSKPGRFLVDVFPFLRHLPTWFFGPSFNATLAEYKQTKYDVIEKPHEFVKNQMAAGTAAPSFTSGHLEHGMTPDEEFVLKHAAAALYVGGTETTISAVHSFILAMTLYPDIQRKAQAELDEVIGTGALPLIADRERLPYMDALVKEVHRWNPVAPLGIPHAAKNDDIYESHFIPKGSIVIPNIWQFLHDPEIYNDPMGFNPDRFLPSSQGNEPEQDPREYCFGFGRRICAGLALADASVFIFCATVLAIFDISKATARDKNGNEVEVEPVVDYTSGFVSQPKPFKCTMVPRSVKAEALIRADELH